MDFGRLVFVGICACSSFCFSAEDLFQDITQQLQKPKEPATQPNYFVDFAKAISKKNNYVAYKEVYASGRYSCDLHKTEGRNSLGFLLFGTFPGEEGQLGDLNLQGRATYYNDQFTHGMMMPNEYTKRLNQGKLELHNAYMRLRAYPPLCNVRVGHFYVPFGLQPWIDTHGTLLQGPTMGFIGMERDWGISFDGQNNLFEYQAGLTRGSGMEYFERNNNFALAGKISTPRIGERVNDWMGISYLMGRIYDPMAQERMPRTNIKGNIVPRWRVGIDGQKIIGPARIRFEISGGKDARKATLFGQFFELKYILGKHNKYNGFLQLENLLQDKKKCDTTIRFGLTYVFSANYNLQFVISRDLNTLWGKKDTWAGLLFYGQIGE